MTEISKSNLREEIKIRVPRSELQLVRTAVHENTLLFSEQYPPRTVRNIYYDTHDLEFFNDNIDGIGNRQKLRIRWYNGKISRIEDATFERKIRVNMLGYKITQKFRPEIDLKDINWQTFSGKMLQACNEASIYQELARTVPTLVNCYRREYYIACNAPIRITLDYDLEFFDQRNKSSFSQIPEILPKHIMVIEIKGAQKDQSLIKEVCRQFKYRITKSSKYVMGLTSLGYN